MFVTATAQTRWLCHPMELLALRALASRDQGWTRDDEICRHCVDTYQRRGWLTGSGWPADPWVLSPEGIILVTTFGATDGQYRPEIR